MATADLVLHADSCILVLAANLQVKNDKEIGKWSGLRKINAEGDVHKLMVKNDREIGEWSCLRKINAEGDVHKLMVKNDREIGEWSCLRKINAEGEVYKLMGSPLKQKETGKISLNSSWELVSRRTSRMRRAVPV
eukprot:482175_1